MKNIDMEDIFALIAISAVFAGIAYMVVGAHGLIGVGILLGFVLLCRVLGAFL